jgi:hypothetical protein
MDKNNLVILRGSNELKLGSDTLTRTLSSP